MAQGLRDAEEPLRFSRRAEIALEEGSNGFAEVLKLWGELHRTYGTSEQDDRLVEAEWRLVSLNRNADLINSWAATPEFPEQIEELHRMEVSGAIPLPDLAALVFHYWSTRNRDAAELVYQNLLEYEGYYESILETYTAAGERNKVPLYGELAREHVRLIAALDLEPSQAVESYWRYLNSDGLVDSDRFETWRHERKRAVEEFSKLGRGHCLELFERALLNPDLRGSSASPTAKSIALGAIELLGACEELGPEETRSTVLLEIGNKLAKGMFLGLGTDLRRPLYFATYKYLEGEQILREILHGVGPGVEAALPDRVTALQVLGARKLIEWGDLIKLTRDDEPRLARVALATAGNFVIPDSSLENNPDSFSAQEKASAEDAKQLLLGIATDDQADDCMRVISVLLTKHLPVSLAFSSCGLGFV